LFLGWLRAPVDDPGLVFGAVSHALLGNGFLYFYSNLRAHWFRPGSDEIRRRWRALYDLHRCRAGPILSFSEVLVDILTPAGARVFSNSVQGAGES